MSRATPSSLSTAAAVRPGAVMDRRIECVLTTLANDLSAGRSLDGLAASVNLSGSRLRHLFRRHAGFTLSQYVTAAKMEKARTLLEDSFLNVKQVMHAAGFFDQTHFIRVFKKHFGATPARYRAECAQRKRISGR